MSAEKIIAQAGITKVTFYRHFPPKDDLIVPVADTTAEPSTRSGRGEHGRVWRFGAAWPTEDLPTATRARRPLPLARASCPHGYHAVNARALTRPAEPPWNG